MSILSKLKKMYRYYKYRILVFASGGNLEFLHGVPSFGKGNEISVSKKAKLKIGSIRTENNVLLAVAGVGHMTIHDSFFNQNCVVVCRNDITIQKGCLFGPNVMIYDHDHKFDYKGISSSDYSTGYVHIGKGCWIGGGAIILKNTEIGEGSI